MNVAFTEFKPSSELSSYIQTYWIGNFNLNGDSNFVQSVVPNGCIELIIHMTDDHCFLSKEDTQWNESPMYTLVGLYPTSYGVRFTEKVKVFGIRFYPDGIRNVFGIPPAEFLSTYEDSLDVLGKDFFDFCSRIREANDPTRQVRLTDRFIISQLAKNRRVYDNAHLAMKLIRQTQGLENYQKLTEQIPISLRQLQREFKNQYGLTIKDYMRISRINAIHQYMQTNNGSLTKLAYDLDFTDQSHFIREYKNHVGIAPKKFTKNQDAFIVNIG